MKQQGCQQQAVVMSFVKEPLYYEKEMCYLIPVIVRNQDQDSDTCQETEFEFSVNTTISAGTVGFGQETLSVPAGKARYNTIQFCTSSQPPLSGSIFFSVSSSVAQHTFSSSTFLSLVCQKCQCF